VGIVRDCQKVGGRKIMGFHKPSCMFVKMGKGVGRTTLNFERERVFFNCVYFCYLGMSWLLWLQACKYFEFLKVIERHIYST
jgi:hypothetical protein